MSARPSSAIAWNTRRRRAFSLIEALVAIAFAALAGSTLMMGTFSALQTTHDGEEQAIAAGMAEQLMDELIGMRYVNDSGSAYATSIQPSSGEVSGVSRRLFDDIGDFNGYKAKPPVDTYGIALGIEDGSGSQRNVNFQVPSGRFTNWQQQVSVYYVSASNLVTPLSGASTSDYRAVEVRIVYVHPANGSTRQLALLRRVITYVSPVQ